ncbi:MAG: hypothetical protein WD512_15390 [Candidatus Paceibacterota bacterium]
MNWKEWVGKIVFIKLDDGQIFSFSKILLYESPFLSLKDKYGLPAIIKTSTIVKIKERENEIVALP